MIKRILFVVVLFQFSACAELQQVVNQLPNGMITNDQIGGGLKEALNNGITNQVSKLAIEDGFYKQIESLISKIDSLSFQFVKNNYPE